MEPIRLTRTTLNSHPWQPLCPREGVPSAMSVSVRDNKRHVVAVDNDISRTNGPRNKAKWNRKISPTTQWT
ncbi:hypothetical protein KQX54_021481 [Cotesia glomerata]|uniref:Uncharacterized protein n=1 Tax=Cotesia glomerata TaxID=32391 RepID=A0AAV7IW27_COTGL|nr:hypothetical protein KQX54_021481 [Cotesia glomerata]